MNPNVHADWLERRVGMETMSGTQGFGTFPPLSGATRRDAPDLLD